MPKWSGIQTLASFRSGSRICASRQPSRRASAEASPAAYLPSDALVPLPLGRMPASRDWAVARWPTGKAPSYAPALGRQAIRHAAEAEAAWETWHTGPHSISCPASAPGRPHRWLTPGPISRVEKFDLPQSGFSPAMINPNPETVCIIWSYVGALLQTSPQS